MKPRIAAMAVLGLFAATAGCTLDGTSPRERVAPPPRHEAPDDSLGVYTARLDAPALAALRNEGVDVAEAAPTSARDGSPAVEVVLSGRQAGDLTARGVVLDPRRPTDAAGGHDVFRPYSGPGGISEELWPRTTPAPPAARRAPPGPGTPSPATRPAGSTPASTCPPTPAGRSAGQPGRLRPHHDAHRPGGLGLHGGHRAVRLRPRVPGHPRDPRHHARPGPGPSAPVTWPGVNSGTGAPRRR
jgi:hypothetical protein